MERLLKLPTFVKERLLKTHAIMILHPEDPEKSQEVNGCMADAIEAQGIQYMISMLDKEELKKIVVVPADRKYTTKAAYAKFFFAQVSQDGLKKYLESCDQDMLKMFAEQLLIPDLPSKSAAAREVIREAVMNLGVVSFLTPVDAGLLRKICKYLKLHVTEEHSKTQLLEAITQGKVPKPEKKARAVVKPHKEKQPIKKGIIKEDLHQHYNLEDLVQWCKDHKVKSNGPKKQVIKRILAFLDGDTSVISEKAASPKKKKAAKKEESEEEEAEEKPAKEEEKPEERKRKKSASSSEEEGSGDEEKAKSPSKKKAKVEKK